MVTYDYKSQKGLGASGILFAAGGLFGAWFIFLFIMDSIRDGHSEKRQQRMEVYDERDREAKKAFMPKVKRSVKGYQINR